jgi:NifB/MoaA-like Fe-S oxidoreductase
VNSSSDEKALGVVDIRSLRERQRGVVEADLITVKEAEWDQVHAAVARLRAELARKDQAINEIRALVADAEARPFVAFGGVKSPGILDLGSLQRILSDLSEHQEGAK